MRRDGTRLLWSKDHILSVVPAKAGTHDESSPNVSLWLSVPAFAGTTLWRHRALTISLWLAAPAATDSGVFISPRLR
ncbi:hypothetical protein UB31_24975 [Bradyrhizobium sp. LTSP849]|nr:hypothetical protein UB31_24975 [Bradyrhizobium sp. LTSP849]